jgi:hypothetical protein
MCCFITSLFLLGPRAAILIWWLLEPLRWQLVFDDKWFWGIVGIIFVPWTTLMWVLVAPGGLVGFDWILLALAIFADIAMWTGGGYGNRNRIPQ